MRIGHYMRGMWEKGGVASYIRRISGAQVKRGHELYFFDSQPDATGTSSATFVRDDTDLFRAAASSDLDVLHVHTAISRGARPTVPTIRTVHGHQPYCPSGSRFLKRDAVPCDRSFSVAGCLRGHFVDHCGSMRPANVLTNFRLTRDEMATLSYIPAITVSQFLKDQMVRSGYQASNIAVLHLPAPERKGYMPPPNDDVPHFVFAGRLAPQKGVEWLLKSVKEVSTPCHLDIAGDGYLESDLRSLSRRLGIEERVTFHGWVDGDAINRLMQNARALVFPSVWHEPGGTVAFEAMVNGRAVIQSRVGGMPEVVTDGHSGLIVEPTDTVGLAAAIHRLATDWEEARRLGERGYETVLARFGMDQHVAALMQHYDRCRLEFAGRDAHATSRIEVEECTGRVDVAGTGAK